MMRAAAIGLVLAACQSSSPGDTSSISASSSTTTTSTETSGADESSATADTTSPTEPTSTGDPGYVAHTCGAAGDQLLGYQFDAEPDCNVLLGGLHISDQPYTDLSSLSRIRVVHEMLSFFRNEQLETMHGLEALESIGGLLIHHHPVLVDLSALARISELPGEVTLASNLALEGLEGLENVKSAGSLRIERNDQLSSLAGLAGLERVDGDVLIRDNPKLSQKEAEAFVAGLEVGGTIEVSGNGS